MITNFPLGIRLVGTKVPFLCLALFSFSLYYRTRQAPVCIGSRTRRALSSRHTLMSLAPHAPKSKLDPTPWLAIHACGLTSCRVLLSAKSISNLFLVNWSIDQSYSILKSTLVDDHLWLQYEPQLLPFGLAKYGNEAGQFTFPPLQADPRCTSLPVESYKAPRYSHTVTPF